MIVYKAEHWPKGNEKKARLLGLLVISDEGRGFPDANSVQISQCRCSEELAVRTGKKLRLLLRDKTRWHTGKFLEFPDEVKGPWALLHHALGLIKGEI